MYFEGEGAWKLMGLEQVARAGAARRPGALRALRYAAPELLLTELQEGVRGCISFARGALVLCMMRVAMGGAPLCCNMWCRLEYTEQARTCGWYAGLNWPGSVAVMWRLCAARTCHARVMGVQCHQSCGESSCE